MRLVVTRPEPDATRTADRLRDAGHAVLVAPLLQLAIEPPQSVKKPAAIAVTSRNGVRALSSWPAASGWLDTPLFVVGTATAEAATESGFRDIHSANGDGRALAAMIAATRSPADGPILYPAAADRSSDMETLLREAGFEVETMIAYRMEAPARLPPALADALRSASVDGVLLYSRRSAEIFRNLVAEAGLTERLAGLRFFVLSPAVAGVFDGLATGRIEVAAAPREDALVSLIPAIC